MMIIINKPRFCSVKSCPSPGNPVDASATPTAGQRGPCLFILYVLRIEKVGRGREDVGEELWEEENVDEREREKNGMRINIE